MNTGQNTSQKEMFRFDGETFEPALDFSRLARQAANVFDFVRDGKWHTLKEISEATSAPEASVSARLRDFRRMGCDVDRRRKGNGFGGLWEYRLVTDGV